jgi:hypothetical protein
MANTIPTPEELVALALPSVVEGLKKDLSGRIEWQVKEDAAKLVSAHVQEYVKSEILPAITLQLIESKDGLIALGGTLGPAIVEALTASLLAGLKERLEKSWERDIIFKAMFSR